MKRIRNFKSKKRVILIAGLAGLIIAFLFIRKEEKLEISGEEKARPVGAVSIEEETHPISLYYIGSIESDEMKKISFKGPGKIEGIYVKEGDFVSKGSVIAKLDSSDLSRNLDLAVKQVEIADSNYEKAKEDYGFTQEYHERAKLLYKCGGMSKQELDQSQLKLDMKKTALDICQSQCEQAYINHDIAKSRLDDAAVLSLESGYIGDVSAKEGENINAGMPVALMRPEKQIVHVGMSQRDVKKIRLGQDAEIEIDGIEGRGKIMKIDNIPDQDSKTYDVEVELTKKFESNNFLIGSIAQVSIELGEKTGVYLPISSVMSDGEEFVYTVADDRIVRRNIEILKTCEDKVLVGGVENGDVLVVGGMKTVKPGYLVEIKE